MPLLPCPECKTEVSDQATACPKCGCPIKGTPAVATTTASNDPKQVRNHLIYLSWLVSGIVMAVVSSFPKPRSRSQEESMLLAFFALVGVGMVINSILMWRDQRQIVQHLPSRKAPSLAVALLLPRLIYLDQRRRALERGTWMMVVEFAAFWVPAIASAFM